MGKVVLTNKAALRAKYGTRVSQVTAAVRDLIRADKRNGISTRLIALDSPSSMRGLGQPVSDANDQAQNKEAVDGVYRALAPDYILLLGAPDVIPHQDLRNPAYHPEYDDDRFVPSDLPYASEGSASDDPRNFTAVTRVVGRLPDILGSRDPSYLTGLLRKAARAIALRPEDFRAYFGITAQDWEGSSRLSLQAVFGSSTDLQQIPPHGYRWGANLLGRRAHFINCHGAASSWQFYGQPRGVDEYPVSHDARYIPARIASGTVVAAECCYGAQLYDPNPTRAKSVGLCNVYLANGAYGFFGSSNIAYGPKTSNDWADDLCQYFWRHILDGSSLGAAVLRARQDYVSERQRLDPIDQKTLAQFNLLGDPSIHPVKVPVAEQATAPAKSIGKAVVHSLSLAVGRSDRRRNMFATGMAIAESTGVAVPASASRSGGIKSSLRSLAKAERLNKPEFLSYDVTQPIPAPGRAEPHVRAVAHAMRPAAPGAERIHLVMGRGSNKKAPAPQIIAIVAKENGGKIVSYRTGYSR